MRMVKEEDGATQVPRGVAGRYVGSLVRLRGCNGQPGRGAMRGAAALEGGLFGND